MIPDRVRTKMVFFGACRSKFKDIKQSVLERRLSVINGDGVRVAGKRVQGLLGDR